MNESTKWHQKRINNGDYDNYIKGDILDIGCGPDPINSPNGTTKGWDVLDGDGQLLSPIEDESFDCVYSSHSIEHMVNVETALINWSRVLRPGGYLYIVIPDFDLYEKSRFPSMYNGDHKHTFSINKIKAEVGRDNHYNILEDIFPILKSIGMSIKKIELQDYNFDYNNFMADQTLGEAEAQILLIAKKGGFDG